MTKLLVIYYSGYGHGEILTGGDGGCRPGETELELARFQGRPIAETAARLSARTGRAAS